MSLLPSSANQGIVVGGASHLLKAHDISTATPLPQGKAAGVREPQGPGLLLTGVNSRRFAGLTALRNGAQQQPFKRASMRTNRQAESATIHPFPSLDTADRINAVRLRVSMIEMAVLGLSELYGRSNAGSGIQIALCEIADELAAISDTVHPARGRA